jgi:N utilization substance protein A
MNNELLAVLDYLERDRGLDREVITQVIEEALVSAARRSVGPANGLDVHLDSATGEIHATAKLKVVDKIEEPLAEIDIIEARKKLPDVSIGDEVDWEVTPENFGRIAAQTAKQGILQRLREAETAQIREEHINRIGENLYGSISRYDKGDIIIDFGRAEGVLRHQDRVPTEDYQIGDHIGCVLIDVNMNRQGPILIVSRADPMLVQRLFEREVAEIGEKIVEIKGVAREPGYRTKIAVVSNDQKVDPVGACVGVRGSRVKAIVRELNGEKVDIVRWAENLSTYITNALQPAEVRDLVIDEDRKIVQCIVDPDQLSLAIGKRGQNVRLTAKLTGCKIDIQKFEDKKELDFAEKVRQAVAKLATLPGVTEEIADTLVQNGFLSIEGLQEADEADIAAIENFDADTAHSIKQAVTEIAETPAPVSEAEPKNVNSLPSQPPATAIGPEPADDGTAAESVAEAVAEPAPVSEAEPENANSLPSQPPATAFPEQGSPASHPPPVDEPLPVSTELESNEEQKKKS